MKFPRLSLIITLLLVNSIYVFPAVSPEFTEFKVENKGLITRITSGDLALSVHFLGPNTLPRSSDPAGWSLVQSGSSYMRLGGISGHLNTNSYSTGSSLVECQVWVSDGNDLVAFRQVFTNKSKKPVNLNNPYPLFIDGKENFKFGTISDWRILGQFRHKNDLPGTDVPVAGKKISCDPFFIINTNKGEGRNMLIGNQTFSLHLADISISFDNNTQQ